MPSTACVLWNHGYTRSTEGIIKLVELFFGGGAWGIIAATTPTLNGPYAFYMWVAVGTWTITLATYLMNVTSQKTEPQPAFHDLLTAFLFGLAHLIAAIVFCVYSFAYKAWIFDQAITIAILEWITTVLYFLHGISMLTHFVASKGVNDRPDWFWSTTSVEKSPEARKHKSDQFSEVVVSNPTAVASYQGNASDHQQPSPMVGHRPMPSPIASSGRGRQQQQQQQQTDDTNEESGSQNDHVIYEDVPMEIGDYRNVQKGGENQNNSSNRGGAEENAYLNPV